MESMVIKKSNSQDAFESDGLKMTKFIANFYKMNAKSMKFDIAKQNTVELIANLIIDSLKQYYDEIKKNDQKLD